MYLQILYAKYMMLNVRLVIEGKHHIIYVLFMYKKCNFRWWSIKYTSFATTNRSAELHIT